MSGVTQAAVTSTTIERISATQALATPYALVDVRAPIEFNKGAPVDSLNLPILTDAERTRIGITYKQQGQEAAVRIGHRLVAGAMREARVSGWQQALSGARGALYCWRGGLRSQIAASWLAEAGYHVPIVEGGYKALRQQALSLLERMPADQSVVVLAGRTGSGKTDVINQVPWSLDLEGLAHHRGSAFGAGRQPQPTPAGFDFALAHAVQSHAAHHVLLEDESRTIGRLALPQSWFDAMQQAPLILLETPMAQRVDNIVREYIDEPMALGTPAWALRRRFDAALDKIRKRLGGVRHQQLKTALADGFAGNGHEAWVEGLLREYYDPMYDFQLERKRERVQFVGDHCEVHQYLEDLPTR